LHEFDQPPGSEGVRSDLSNIAPSLAGLEAAEQLPAADELLHINTSNSPEFKSACFK
jgi:hypothetical protein